MYKLARWDGEKWCGLFTQEFEQELEFEQHVSAMGFFEDRLIIVHPYVYDGGTYDSFWIYDGGDEVSACMEPTSVSEIQDSDFEIYPNPVSGNIKSIRIKSNIGLNGLVSIYTSDGRLIKKDMRIDGNSLLSLPDLAPGIYILSFEFGQKKLSKKLVIL